MTYTLTLTDEEMTTLRVALNIRVVQQGKRENDRMTPLSDRLNRTKPDREESHD